MEGIPNERLTVTDLPPPGAALWPDINRFARQFHWTDYYPGPRPDHISAEYRRCVQALEQGTLSDMQLSTLRAALWWRCETLRWQVSGGPRETPEQLAEAHTLLEAIRVKVQTADRT